MVKSMNYDYDIIPRCGLIYNLHKFIKLIQVVSI